mmetsp:Transcript_109336/g.211703  ORF Transcript_109336/g.211703 Transcript_109336/m.211703 type:complete len:101 (-) Transcript_109336:155-457(-)
MHSQESGTTSPGHSTGTLAGKDGCVAAVGDTLARSAGDIEDTTETEVARGGFGRVGNTERGDGCMESIAMMFLTPGGPVGPDGPILERPCGSKLAAGDKC